MIYLDNPATSMKKPKIVYDMIYKNTVNCSVNAGRGGHFASIRGAEGIIKTQETISELFNIKTPERIAFTPNATYALNMAISGFLSPHDHVIITSMEHNSVLRPVHRLCSYTIVKADKRGVINPRDIESAIQKNTKLIITTHASNVCGTVMPVYEIGKICKKHGIPYLLDTAQTAGIIPIDVEEMNVSLLAFSGHKGLLGPLGTGGLYVADNIDLEPLIVGGTGTESANRNQPKNMPDMLHSGTMNTPAIMTLADSIKYITGIGVKNIGMHEKNLAIYLIDGLLNIGGVEVYGLKNGDRNGTVAFNIKNADSQEISDILNSDYQIATRGGYHCSYIAHETLGTEKTGAVRAGFGAFSTKDEANALLFAVSKIYQKMRK
ncbi:MAG: aminotransferase class V-fold PLP-dependent enzyme [Clostridia bacterium]|nr:aminotransferase class V-fold PLP-dependent enzyme [Clostridia bacterium]